MNISIREYTHSKDLFVRLNISETSLQGFDRGLEIMFTNLPTINLVF